METRKKLMLGAAIVSLSGVAAMHNPVFAADTATGDATGTVLQAVTITQDTAFNFGRVTVATGTAGTVTIAADGTRSVSGGVGEAGGSPSQGVFTVTGDGNTNVVVSATANTFTVTNGSTNLNITGLSLSAENTATQSPATNGITYSFTNGTTSTVNVAGNASLPAGQASGTYNGTYTMNVQYQ